MTLRGVLFDLGGTVLYYTEPGKTWEDMEKLGAQGAYRYLRDHHYPLPQEADALTTAWEYARALWGSLDEHDVKQLKLGLQLGFMARQWGVDNLPDDVLDALALAYMAEVQSTVRPLEGAAETLRALRERGLRLGLISNTVWPGPSHRQDLDRWGLTSYFDHLIFSADAELWKPHREVFQQGLDALGLKPDEAIFVGDSLYFDIWGAQQAGMRAVWIRQPVPWVPEGIDVTPDATITALPDLLGVVEAWSHPVEDDEAAD